MSELEKLAAIRSILLTLRTQVVRMGITYEEAIIATLREIDKRKNELKTQQGKGE